MTRDIVPVKIGRETRDDLAFLKRELSAKYNRDYTFSDVIDALMHGYSPGNPRLAVALREIVNRRPVRGFPETPKDQEE
jgi:hypothetical protein